MKDNKRNEFWISTHYNCKMVIIDLYDENYATIPKKTRYQCIRRWLHKDQEVKKVGINGGIGSIEQPLLYINGKLHRKMVSFIDQHILNSIEMFNVWYEDNEVYLAYINSKSNRN